MFLQMYERALQGLSDTARPLELALIKHMKHDKTLDILAELGKFQNSDGGFGNSLEPDLRMPYSSAVATEFAINILTVLDSKLVQEHAITKGIVKYLEATYLSQTNGWEIVTKEVDHYPHAIWWNYKDIHDFGPYNPTATLLGFLYKYAKDSLVINVPEAVGLFIAEVERKSANTIDEHAIFCLQRLLTYLPKEEVSRIENKICEAIELIIEKDPKKWVVYSPEPIKYIDAPSHPLYQKYSDLVKLNLWNVLESRNSSGYWEVKHQWFQYEDEFEKTAKIEWCGVFTYDNLKRIKALETLL